MCISTCILNIITRLYTIVIFSFLLIHRGKAVNSVLSVYLVINKTQHPVHCHNVTECCHTVFSATGKFFHARNMSFPFPLDYSHSHPRANMETYSCYCAHGIPMGMGFAIA